MSISRTADGNSYQFDIGSIPPTFLKEQLEIPPIASPQSSTEVVKSKPQVGRGAAMISPLWDNLLIGGLSIIVFIFYWLFVDKEASTVNVSETAFWLSFIVNFPHFISSYLILYYDNRKQLFTKKSFIWAGLIVPVLLIAVIGFGAFNGDSAWLGLLVQFMYFSVGWHYVKQIFGTAVVASAVEKKYFSPWERCSILLNLYSVWALSWVYANLGRNKNALDGMAYYTLDLPENLLYLAYGAVLISFLWALILGFRKFILTGVRPANSSLFSFAAIYVWYLPSLYHPLFFFLVPFFHSLQYLLFVHTLKKNEYLETASKISVPESKRFMFLKYYGGFFIISLIVGALVFEVIPRTLDQFVPVKAAVFGPSFWMFAFAIFINLHHYFVDNVIWRKDNPLLNKFIVKASQTNV